MAVQGQVRDSLPVQEHLLLDYAQRLEHRKAHHRAVHVHLSQLKPYHRRPHHVRIAAKMFEDLIKLHDGQLFVLGNSDLVFIWRGSNLDEIRPAVDTLRYLFREDPLTQGDDSAGGFCTWFNMSTHYKDFLLTAARLHEEERRRALNHGPRRSDDDSEKSIVPVQLHQIEDILANANLTNYLRWQPVCAIIPGAEPHPVFQELFVSIEALEQRLVPGHSLQRNRWLFQQMTRSLDERVIATISAGRAPIPGKSISVNLNIDTVLSETFDQFAAQMQDAWKGRIIVEIDNIDVIANVDIYPRALETVHAKGYRVCLDGLTHLSVPFIDRDQLGAELVKVQWSSDIMETVVGDRKKELRDILGKAGRERAILNRCDDERAIEFGHSLGITLFQGNLIDRMLADNARSSAFVS